MTQTQDQVKDVVKVTLAGLGFDPERGLKWIRIDDG